MPGSGSLNIMRGIHSLHTYKSPIIVVDGMYIKDYNFEDPAITGNVLFSLLGIHPSSIKEIVFVKMENGSAVFSLGSGEYSFESQIKKY